MLTRLELLGSDDAAGDAVGVRLVVVMVVVETSGDHGERWNYCRIADAGVVRSRGERAAAAAVLVLVWVVWCEEKKKKESVGDCIGLGDKGHVFRVRYTARGAAMVTGTRDGEGGGGDWVRWRACIGWLAAGGETVRVAGSLVDLAVVIFFVWVENRGGDLPRQFGGSDAGNRGKTRETGRCPFPGSQW